MIQISKKIVLEPPQKVDFGAVCKRVREELTFTQDKMASYLGVPKRTYLSWEYGETQPAGEIAVWLADTYRNIEGQKSKLPTPINTTPTE